MTVRQLKEAVAHLGFVRTLEELDETLVPHFYHMLSRGLWTVSSLRPAVGQYMLHHFPPENLLPSSEYTHEGGVLLEIHASGVKTYTFTVTGSGTCRVSGGGREVVYRWERATSGRQFAGFWDGGEMTLSFSGEERYPVRGLAAYRERTEGSEAEIPPYTPAVRYDLSRMIPRFRGLVRTPIEGDPTAVSVPDAHTVVIRRDAPGVYAVDYTLTPPEITVDTDPDLPIDMDEELCQLLPLLLASLLCLEDDPDKAAYYAALYREQYATVRAAEVPRACARVVSTNGW